MTYGNYSNWRPHGLGLSREQQEDQDPYQQAREAVENLGYESAMDPDLVEQVHYFLHECPDATEGELREAVEEYLARPCIVCGDPACDGTCVADSGSTAVTVMDDSEPPEYLMNPPAPDYREGNAAWLGGMGR